MSKVAIVAPVHIQPSEEWVNALWEEAKEAGAHVIIVDDSDGKVELPWSHDGSGDVYTYAKQKEALGEELYAMFEQFHHSAACKNFGTWVAWRDEFDVVIVIDSDCVVPKGFVQNHLESLENKGQGWENPLAGTGYFSRGFPYSKRSLPLWANMGLWTDTLDLYGKDRVDQGKPKREVPEIISAFPAAHFPLSGMNVAFKREAIPYMLFLPNFAYLRHKFTRHDDIWGGYILQKIAQQKGAALSYGLPFVRHVSEVDAADDAKAEEPMVKFEDDFYAAVDNALVFSGSGCGGHSGPEIFLWLSQELGANEIFGGLREAFKFWSLAFQ